MRRHRLEHPRILGQRLPPGCGNNRARRRPPCPSQRSRGDQLSQTIHRQHRQSRDTRPPGDTLGCTHLKLDPSSAQHLGQGRAC